jgi:4-hydroxy-tetrahydrodipicolinate synthase
MKHTYYSKKQLTNQFPLWTAIITPFDHHGKIQFQDFEKLLKRQEEAGNGILILGSTGEALALSESEKKSVVQFSCSLNLQVPLMVGVGGYDLSQCLEWIEFCETMPLSAYLMVTPLYAKPGPIGQLQWFQYLLKKTKRPSMLYNIPSRAGVKLHFQTWEKLIEHPESSLWAIKESSGNLDDFSQFCSLSERFQKEDSPLAIYSGEDPLVSFSCQLGGAGLVSVVSNIWPKWAHDVVKKSLQGNLSVEELKKWRKASSALFTVTNPIPAKIISHEMGLISTPQLRMPLTSDEWVNGSSMAKKLMKEIEMHE